MSTKDMAVYHKAQAQHFHELAQVARRAVKDAKAERCFVAAAKAECRWREYRQTRDQHKAKAREISGQA